jgi:DNA-directed RNA polymerase beta subunit
MTAGMNAEIWTGAAIVACDTRRIVKNLVRWTIGMWQPELIEENKNFWIILREAMVKPGPFESSFLIVSRIQEDLEKEIGRGDIKDKLEEKLEEMERDGWERKFGILVSKDVGREYFAIPVEDSISTLHTDEKAVLFTQLTENLATLWYLQNKEMLIPSYMFLNPQVFPAEDTQRLEDATAFREPQYMAVYNMLKARGYSPKGQYRMISGKTGVESKATLFVGPCMWMQLRHLTDSKYQIRDQGSMSVASRGAAKGKAVGGAVRNGELSHSAILAHGNMSYLAERFMTAADKYEALICEKCGDQCYKHARSAVIKCETCGSTAIPRVVTMPYSGVRFLSILAASGVRPRIATQEDPRYKYNVLSSVKFEEVSSTNPREFMM